MQGLISINPAHSVVKPKLPKVEMKVLTEEHAQSLLSAADSHRIEAIIVLALTTGMRQGEILALKWSDLNWDQRTIKVDLPFLMY